MIRLFMFENVYMLLTTYSDKMNLTRLLTNLICKKATSDKNLRDNYPIDIVKVKGFEGEVKVIAQRLYVRKYKRLPVFHNGIKSWVNFYIKTDLLLLEAAYSEFGASAFRGDPDENRREKFQQHNWAMKRRRNVRKLYHEQRKACEFKNDNTAL
jgi:hypothetical protein